MKNVLKFAKSQKLMVLASNTAKDLWIANVYIGVDEKFSIYFISPKGAKHSQMILDNPNVAFSIAWFNPTNHGDRKAIQGLGVCHLVEDKKEISKGVKLHNQNFPEFKEKITVDWIYNNEWESKVWILKPTYIKYWDDEIYGDKETKEFNLK